MVDGMGLLMPVREEHYAPDPMKSSGESGWLTPAGLREERWFLE